MNKTTIDSAGRILLSNAVAREVGNCPLEVVSHSDRHILLADGGASGNVTLTGVLGDLGVPDLLSFFNMFRKTGVLRFRLAGGNKDLYFQDGEVVFATSSFLEEDLGEILCGLGKIDRDSLQRLRRLANEKGRLGKLLVEKGAATPKDLWLGTRQQVETIVYNLFTAHQGSFSFVAKALEKEEIVRLSMSTQNLIMEGLRRVDERALFMRRIGSMEAIPVPGDRPPAELSPAARRMMLVIREGKYDVRDLLRKSGVDEFEGIRCLYQMIEKGQVAMEEAPSVTVEGDLGEVLNVFNGALVVLYRQVSEKNADFAQQMQLFLRDLPQPFSYVFRDASLRQDGSIDGRRILGNLAGLEEGDKKRLLVEALSELVYAECGLARQELGKAESDELIQRVQEVTRRVKNIIGRNE